jgi:hypothetical protein
MFKHRLDHSLLLERRDFSNRVVRSRYRTQYSPSLRVRSLRVRRAFLLMVEAEEAEGYVELRACTQS